jgi:hypothetical protein
MRRCSMAARDEMIRNLVGNPTIADRREPRLKPLFDNLGMRCCQSVLGSQIPIRPRQPPRPMNYSRQLLKQAFAKTCRKLYSEDSPCYRVWRLRPSIQYSGWYCDHIEPLDRFHAQRDLLSERSTSFRSVARLPHTAG